MPLVVTPLQNSTFLQASKVSATLLLGFLFLPSIFTSLFFISLSFFLILLISWIFVPVFLSSIVFRFSIRTLVKISMNSCFWVLHSSSTSAIAPTKTDKEVKNLDDNQVCLEFDHSEVPSFCESEEEEREEDGRERMSESEEDSWQIQVLKAIKRGEDKSEYAFLLSFVALYGLSFLDGQVNLESGGLYCPKGKSPGSGDFPWL
ncbi:hypothetical protein HHK36_024407 [Tetracentron sinense]|uniref:Uncharacterized protein n=1 Tax=Tetracentron sinense TaxID=13715 RepID=A0A834YJC6_TETSI|nr:hypothetical protein HHK36_024407 [Tetracentron sinense]